MRLGEERQSHGSETVTQEELFAEMDAYREAHDRWWENPVRGHKEGVVIMRNVVTGVTTVIRLADGAKSERPND